MQRESVGQVKFGNKTSDLPFQKDYEEPICNITKLSIYHNVFLIF
jgi:hypothetical protein